MRIPKKSYYIIDNYYLNNNMYNLKIGKIVCNKEQKPIWRTTIILGPSALKKMLWTHGKKQAELNKTRLLVGIKNGQEYKPADIRKEVTIDELP